VNKKKTVLARIDGTRRRVTIEEIGKDIDTLTCGCPHCGCDHVTVRADILQLGMWEDRGMLLKTCDKCGKAYGFSYTIDVDQTLLEETQDDQQHD
jgi:hypothetical protein